MGKAVSIKVNILQGSLNYFWVASICFGCFPFNQPEKDALEHTHTNPIVISEDVTSTGDSKAKWWVVQRVSCGKTSHKWVLCQSRGNPP